MKRILVVDDDVINLKIAETILKPLGYKVQTVHSGSAAVFYLENHQVDLVLLDVEMPVMDGIETLKKIRELPGNEDLPVMFLTADSQKETIMNAYKLQACGYLKKPYLPEDLQERVGHILFGE